MKIFVIDFLSERKSMRNMENIKSYILKIVFLLSITININAGILTHEFRTEEFGNIEKTDKDIVILMHGIYSKLDNLEYIEKKLEENGYSGVNIQYPTTKDEIQDIAKKYIEPEIEKKIKVLDEINKKRLSENKKKLKINFVVHSMGSVVLRYQLQENTFEELGKVVFLSPPSHGSSMAGNFFTELLSPYLGKAIKQINVQKDSFVNQLKEPDYNCYVMVGNRANNPLYSVITDGESDGAVPVKSAKLENCKFKIIDGESHSSILKSDKVMQEILKYFKE